jgi:hypothetical protein
MRTMRLKLVGPCLIVALAMSAIVAAAASAEAPEYGRCVKVEKVGKTYAGGFTDSKCTKKSETKTGKYEWHPGAEKVQQTSVGGLAALEQTNGLGVGCKKEHSTGELSGAKEVKNLVVTFEGCESVRIECTSPGRKAGELVTVPLEGKVVWENKAEHKTALDLYPADGAEKFIEFTCGVALTVAVRGSILTPVKPDKMATSATLKFKQKRGIQTPTQYETAGGEKVNDYLESDFSGKGWLQAGQSITSTVTFEEALELNAYV